MTDEQVLTAVLEMLAERDEFELARRLETMKVQESWNDGYDHGDKQGFERGIGMKTSETHTAATGTITVHKANTADEALGMLRNLAEAAKHALITERVDWKTDQDGYGTATLDGEVVATIGRDDHWGDYWTVRLNGVDVEGECTDADDGYRKVVAMLRFLEGWGCDAG